HAPISRPLVWPAMSIRRTTRGSSASRKRWNTVWWVSTMPRATPMKFPLAVARKVAWGEKGGTRAWKNISKASRLYFICRHPKPTVCLDVTSLAVYSYGYNSGKIVQLIAHSLAVSVALHGEHAARTKHRHSPHVQPVAHVW